MILTLILLTVTLLKSVRCSELSCRRSLKLAPFHLGSGWKGTRGNTASYLLTASVDKKACQWKHHLTSNYQYPQPAQHTEKLDSAFIPCHFWYLLAQHTQQLDSLIIPNPLQYFPSPHHNTQQSDSLPVIIPDPLWYMPAKHTQQLDLLIIPNQLSGPALVLTVTYLPSTPSSQTHLS